MYDNLDSAKQKLQGTFCYYEGRAVYVKDIKPKSSDPDVLMNKKFIVYICYLEGLAKFFWRDLDDPKFQYMEFNMGYMNSMGYALWYYRIPHKQWKQGLHSNQVSVRDKSGLTDWHQFHNWGANDTTAAMMENRYPSFEVATEMLNSPGILKVAFSQNFAVYRDGFRKDLVLEHKGYPVAFETVSKTFKCNNELTYLRESIAEMNIKVA